MVNIVDEIERLVTEHDALQEKLDQVRSLYRQRCKETIENVTDDEEMFLANLSEIIYPEEEES